MSKEVMRQALEALEWCHGGEPCGTAEAITALREALAEQPAPSCPECLVGLCHCGLRKAEQPAQQQSCYCPNCEALSKELAAQRTWVGLTDKEIENLWHEFHDREFGWARRFTRAIEAKLKEKNGL